MGNRANITLKQLEALYWSATLGSFALAADRLAMTQSALSKRILELEGEIGAPLFDRSGPRAKVTEIGERIIPKASAMLNLHDEILIAGRGEQSLRGVCRFGITQLMAITSLQDIVSEVRQLYPDIVLEPRVDAVDLIEDVLRGETDFALSPDTSLDPTLSSQYLTRIELSWVCSPELFPLIRTIDAEALQKYPVISMSARAASTNLMNNWATAKGLKFKEIVASNSPEAVAALTIAGLGISLLARPFVERLVATGELRILPTAQELTMPELDYFLHWRKDNDRLLPKAVREIARPICERAGTARRAGA